MNKAINSEIQTNICDIIMKNPGIHLTKIAELLSLNVTQAKEYLDALEDQEVVFSLNNAGYKQYYIEDVRSGIRNRRMIQTRKIICKLIANHPGLHLSKIAEMLNIRLSLAEYHLRNMEKEKIITAVKDVGYYKRYYIAGSEGGIEERKMVSLLREQTPLKIVLYLLKHPNAQHKDILKIFDITSSTLSYHLNKLLQHGMIDIPSAIGERGYNLIDKKEIIRLLKKYRLIPLTESFTDVWDDLKFK